MRAVLVADDLSGAADAGVRFVRAGIPTRVVLDPDSLTRERRGSPISALRSGDPGVLALETDTRHRDVEAAVERVRTVLAAAPLDSADHLVKKIDSTMRGNVGAEVETFLRAAGIEVALLTPAHPTQGREVVDGSLVVRGADADSSIARRLRSQTDLPIGRVRLGDLRAGYDAVADRLGSGASEAGGTPRVLVADSATRNDLDHLVRYARRWTESTDRRLLWVGSAGLVGALAGSIGSPSEGAGSSSGRIDWRAPSPPSAGLGGEEDVLFVVGSLNPRSRDQLARLCENEDVACLEVEADSLPSGETAKGDGDRITERAVRTLRTGRATAVYTPEEPVAGSTDVEERARIAAGLGTLCARICRAAAREEAPVSPRLFITGGETARAVCTALDIFGLDLRYELEDGVPVSRTAGGWNGLLVTKAGGFGTFEVMQRALRWAGDGR